MPNAVPSAPPAVSWGSVLEGDVHVLIEPEPRRREEPSSSLLLPPPGSGPGAACPLQLPPAGAGQGAPTAFADVLQMLADVYAKDIEVYAKDIEALRSENRELRQNLHHFESVAQTDDDGSSVLQPRGSVGHTDDEPGSPHQYRWVGQADDEASRPWLRDLAVCEGGSKAGTGPQEAASSLNSTALKRRSRPDAHGGVSMFRRMSSHGEEVQFQETYSLCSMMRENTGSASLRRFREQAGRRRLRATTVKCFQSRQAWLEVEPSKKTERLKTFRMRTAAFVASTDQAAELVESSTCFRRLVWHPGSYKRLSWDVTSMAFLAYDLVTIPFVGAFNPPQTQFFTWMAWVTLLFWTADILASLVTGYMAERFVVLELKMIALNYLRTWCVVDLIVVGLDWGLVAIQGDMDSGGSAARLGRSLRTLRFVRTLRLIRLVKLKRIFQEIQDHLNTETLSICFGITKIVLCLLMANHVVACGWYAIGVFAESDTQDWVSANDLEGRSISYQYSTSLHWSLTQFTPASMEIHPYNIRERVFSVIVLLFAMLTFSSFVSILTASMAELRRIGNDESQKFWLLRRYLKDWSVSRGVTARVVRYLEYAYQRQRQRVQQADVHLLRLLSEPLREELNHDLFSTCLSVHPLFSVCNGSVRFFTKALQCNSLARGDFVFCCGEEATAVIFASGGTFEYTLGECADGPEAGAAQSGSEAGEYISEGQWVSEAVLWTAWMHLGDLQAITECQTVAVSAEQFASIIKSNKPLHLAMTKYAETFVAELNKLERDELTDLLHQLFSPQEVVDESEFNKACTHMDTDDEEHDGDSDNGVRRGINRLLKFVRPGRHGLESFRPSVQCVPH